MISNVYLNNFSYKKTQNGQNLSFSGNSFVQIKLLGEKHLVPRAVADVTKSVKISFATDKNNKKNRANAINLIDSSFLGVSHLTDHLKKISSFSIGKMFSAKIYSNPAIRIKNNEKMDLSLFSVAMPQGKMVAKSNSVKLAQSLPKIDDNVYIVGYHQEFNGPKIIPAIYIGQKNMNKICKKSVLSFDKPANYDANFIEIFSYVLRDRINPSGLSGAAVVNQKGELIGVLDMGKCNNFNEKSTGEFFAIDIDTIKKFLRKTNSSNDTNDKKPAGSFLSWLKQALFYRKYSS